MKTNLLDTWQVRRLAKGSGKARWHIIAIGLNEYQAQSLVRDANKGSKSWHYKAEPIP